MIDRTPRNLPASVRARLDKLRRARQEDFQLTLMQYARERFLYRLGESLYEDKFVLKGAMLFLKWFGPTYRPTRDVDLLGYGDLSEDLLDRIIRETCSLPVEPDGVEFLLESVRIEPIREGGEYAGLRAQFEARIEQAQVRVQIDVGLGDVVVPEAVKAGYPTMLDFPAPHLRMYPPETVTAENLHTIVARGILNSRLRDYYDLRTIAGRLSFDGPTLVRAMSATFDRRRTAIPDVVPAGLSDEFSSDPDSLTQWRAFLTRAGLEDSDLELAQVVDEVRAFLLPPLLAAAGDEPFEQAWPPGGAWSES